MFRFNSFTAILFGLVASFVQADIANYGSLAYETGGHNQFSMDAMLAITNEDRAAAGASALVIDSRLVAAAVVHCQNMQRSGVFSHDDSNGTPSDRITAQGFRFSSSGENIYTDSYGGDVTAANTAYMNSPGHKANIVNRAFQRVGFAVCGTSQGNQYWVSNFGTEMNDSGAQYLVTPKSPAATSTSTSQLTPPAFSPYQPPNSESKSQTKLKCNRLKRRSKGSIV